MIITTGNPVSLTTAEHRNQTAAMLPPGKVALAVRGGIHSGLGITKTSGMSFRIAAGRAVVCPASPSAGPYTVTVLDPETLSFAPGDASRDRIDVVALKVDESSGNDTPASIVILEGAYPTSGAPVRPAIPAAHEPLFAVAIGAGVSSGSGGWLPEGAIDLRRQLASIGSYIPVRSITERDELLAYEGMTVMRLDLGGSIDRYVRGRWIGNTDWITVELSPGWRNVPGAPICQVRVVADGTMLQVWGEVMYDKGTPPYASVVGRIPAKYKIAPVNNAWIMSTDAMYKGVQVVLLDFSGAIIIGPNPDGNVFMFQGTVPLNFLDN